MSAWKVIRRRGEWLLAEDGCCTAVLFKGKVVWRQRHRRRPHF